MQQYGPAVVTALLHQKSAPRSSLYIKHTRPISGLFIQCGSFFSNFFFCFHTCQFKELSFPWFLLRISAASKTCSWFYRLSALNLSSKVCLFTFMSNLFSRLLPLSSYSQLFSEKLLPLAGGKSCVTKHFFVPTKDSDSLIDGTE